MLYVTVGCFFFSVHHSSYDPYYAIFPLEAGRDETLFWTRTNQLVDLVSMMMASGNIVSSFNVPSTGIIKDIGSDISWCGDASSPGEEYYGLL